MQERMIKMGQRKFNLKFFNRKEDFKIPGMNDIYSEKPRECIEHFKTPGVDAIYPAKLKGLLFPGKILSKNSRVVTRLVAVVTRAEMIDLKREDWK
ncbi:uncharacterized protein LOC119655077 isoform X3 [Hermetia illucens]|uniref:uncharacterized protein LOC119655077 isoform X3 n=1 Tax=Hermetia illucens TaxID=343691 RepID=UPI0018CC60EC|nr:uncharacterized protein LOC119655077 isoform X3 [Hermetia illucens]